MRVLALDTVSPFPTLALRAGTRAGGVREDVEPLPPNAAEHLVERLRTLLGRAGAAPGDLDRVAVLSGPGSFTGLKAGAAFARGLARAIGAPLLSFSTFEAASAARPEPPHVDFLLEAGRGDVHRARRRESGLSESAVPVGRERAVAEATAAGVPICDLGLDPLPLASALARLAAAAPVPARDPAFQPAYGRLSAAEEKADKAEETALSPEGPP